MLSGLAPSKGREGRVCSWSLYLCLFTSSSLCASFCVQISPFYKNTNHIGLSSPEWPHPNLIVRTLASFGTYKLSWLIYQVLHYASSERFSSKSDLGLPPTSHLAKKRRGGEKKRRNMWRGCLEELVLDHIWWGGRTTWSDDSYNSSSPRNDLLVKISTLWLQLSLLILTMQTQSFLQDWCRKYLWSVALGPE